MDTLDTHFGQQETLFAVEGREIYFHFGRKKRTVVLNGVNIAVNRGAIYSLLGPSGCGKTTLLKCVIGQYKPQAGSLKIYGRNPGSKGFFIPGRGVGYMPQNLALYMDMNTEEILTYFGSLCGMRMRDIKERITFLVELLELPNKSKPIQQLSGGQQRRVSFAIALIHEPPLIILDEPTVGVDPLLRKAIWKHLIDLARNVTVIITTHYTEEARQAHTVGLMRNGQLLTERNPEDLIKQYGGFTLEYVFLKVCQKNGNDDECSQAIINERIDKRNLKPICSSTNGAISNETTGESHKDETKFKKSSDEPFDQRNDIQQNNIALLPLPPIPKEVGQQNFRPTTSPRRLFYLTRKNFIRFRKNMTIVVCTVGICAICVAIFFMSWTTDPFDLEMAIVNEERGGLNKFGEKFLLSLSDHTFQKKPFENFSLAYESIKKGESHVILRIDPEFSTCLVDRVLKGVDTSNETIRCSTIKVILDSSNEVIAATIRRSLFRSYEIFAKDLLISLGENPLLGKVPVHIEEYNRGEKPATFAQFTIPGLLLTIAYVISMPISMMTMLAERKQGLLTRANVAGAATTEVLLSFCCTLLILLLLQIIGMLLITFLAFSVPCNGSVFWVTVAVTLAGICGMSYGFLISAVTDDENTSCLLGSGSFFLMLYLSAVFWPIDTMPPYLRFLSNCLPLTRIIESVRSIITRGWNITDNYLWDGYLICSFWIAVQIMLCIILLKIRK